MLDMIKLSLLYSYLFIFLLYFYDNQRNCVVATEEKICGARSLSYKLLENEAKWIQSKSEYYASCKFIHARYNCSRFGSTSATDYHISFNAATTSYPCQVPNDIHMMEKLIKNQVQPVNMIMIGDSHMMQIYQSVLCMFQSIAYDIEVFQASSDSTDIFEKVTYSTYNVAMDCHAIKYKDYDNYYLSKSSMTSGRCQLSHAPGEISCFKLPIEEYIDSINDRRYSMICASYARPYTGIEAVVASLDLSSIGLSVKDMNVIFANAYISSSDLGNHLYSLKYQGKVYALPRYPDAPQIGYKYIVDSISGNIDQTQRGQIQVDIESFCYMINKIYKLSPASDLQGKMCRYLDYTGLSSQRSADAKSCIFPFTYHDHKNRMRICQENATSMSSCIGKDYRVCSSESYPCEVDGHFCLPGPTDEFALLALAAAISYYDYNMPTIPST